jgi:hypothetical protein
VALLQPLLIQRPMPGGWTGAACASKWEAGNSSEVVLHQLFLRCFLSLLTCCASSLAAAAAAERERIYWWVGTFSTEKD